MTVTKSPRAVGISRRAVSAGLISLPIIGAAHRLFAAEGVPIKIGFISPRSGPLAAFGEADPFILDLVRQAVASGVAMSGTQRAIEILDRDTQSDPARAAQLASDLINGEQVNIILASCTPETINPVADACEAAGVPCISTVMPWEAFYFGRGAKPGQPSPFKWSYHFGFGVDEFAQAYISQWNSLTTNKKVGVLYPNDADGNAVRAMLVPRLQEAGFEIFDPGAFEGFTSDYTTQIRYFREHGVEIINSFALPPDFATFWRQSAQQGLTQQVQIVQVAKTGLFQSDIEAMGSLGPKLASAVYWHRDMPYRSTTTGHSAEALAAAYEAATGRQWMLQLGASLALFDVALAALEKSGAADDRAAVAQAIASLSVDTINGPVDFTSGPVPNVAHGPILGSQWQHVEGSAFPVSQVLTENATDPNVPISGALVPYNG
jgi:branched-chain amino acid transport system substrate-binding protein